VNTLLPSFGNTQSTNSTAILMDPAVTPYSGAALTAATGTFGTAAIPWVDDTGINLTQCSYMVNGWLYDVNDKYSEALPADRFNKEANVTSPSKTPVFGDGIWIDTWPLETDLLATYAPVNLYTGNNNNNATGGGGMGRYLIDRHGGLAPKQAPTSVPSGSLNLGAINIGFFDGHVETQVLQNLYLDTWHLNWVQPGNAW
jgi:prepilin-type processing-associated H-X9-DG protein